MMISVRTCASFHPVDEYEAIQDFMKDNDMSDWTEYPSTVAITFVHDRTFFTKGKKNGKED